MSILPISPKFLFFLIFLHLLYPYFYFFHFPSFLSFLSSSGRYIPLLLLLPFFIFYILSPSVPVSWYHTLFSFLFLPFVTFLPSSLFPFFISFFFSFSYHIFVFSAHFFFFMMIFSPSLLLPHQRNSLWEGGVRLENWWQESTSPPSGCWTGVPHPP